MYTGADTCKWHTRKVVHLCMYCELMKMTRFTCVCMYAFMRLHVWVYPGACISFSYTSTLCVHIHECFSTCQGVSVSNPLGNFMG